MEVYTRVVGYLRPVNRWNNGKQSEYARRRTYRVPEPVAAALAEPELQGAAD